MIINQYNQHVNVPNEYNNQACIQWYPELLMCNQEIGTQWSTNQMPYLLHSKFNLDLVNDSQWSCHFVDPILHDAFPLNDEIRFFLFIWWKLWFLEKTWSRHLFLFYF